MANWAFSAPGLRLSLEERAEEAIVHCSGKITAESAETFQTQIRRHVIPVSRGKGVAVVTRIVLDMSNVTFVDSTGLGALFGLWSAAQSRSCNLEIVNLNARVQKLVSLTKLDQVFHRAKGLFNGGGGPKQDARRLSVSAVSHVRSLRPVSPCSQGWTW